MKKIVNATLIACFFMGSISTHANTPSDKSLERLAGIMPYEAVFGEEILAPLYADRNALIYNLGQDTSLTDEQRTNALKAFDDYASGMVKLLDTDAKKKELKNAYIAAAKQHYTQAEVDALIGFYGNEVGQSALRKESSIYNDYLNAIEKSTANTLETYAKANQTKTQDAIKRILNK